MTIKPGVQTPHCSAASSKKHCCNRSSRPPWAIPSTVVIVAQRVSTIRDADLILVVEDGVVVGRGTHHELLEGCETYQEIVASQLSAEEAA